MALSTEEKKAVLAEYGIHETDTGSPEAQIAMLTKRSPSSPSTSRPTSTTTTPVADCSSWSAAGVVCSSTSRRSTSRATARSSSASVCVADPTVASRPPFPVLPEGGEQCFPGAVPRCAPVTRGVFPGSLDTAGAHVPGVDRSD